MSDLNLSLEDRLLAALQVAMTEWAGWLDEARGVHPSDVCDDNEWDSCVKLLGFDPTKRGQ